MKVLITTDLYTTATNGVVTSVRNLAEELRSRGHEVKILTVSDTKESRREGDVTYIGSVSLEKIYPNVRKPITYHHPLIKEIINWKPDVIHTQSEFFTFRLAKQISKKTDAPIIHTYHTLYEQYAGYVIRSKWLGLQVTRILSKLLLLKAVRIIVPSHKIEATLLGYGMKNPISVVPSGISLEQHRRRITAEERTEKRHSLGIADSDCVMVYLGRLGMEKSLDELLRYFADALRERASLKFLIVGDGPARAELESLTASLGITDHVIFTGMVKPSEVQNYYQLGDVFVSASTSETQGLTYIEAAANGLPLLCREDLCLCDVILPGENGYTYTNEDEFLKALDKIRLTPDWRAAAGIRSEEIAMGFDKKTFGEKIEKIYESVRN